MYGSLFYSQNVSYFSYYLGNMILSRIFKCLLRRKKATLTKFSHPCENSNKSTPKAKFLLSNDEAIQTLSKFSKRDSATFKLVNR